MSEKAVKAKKDKSLEGLWEDLGRIEDAVAIALGRLKELEATRATSERVAKIEFMLEPIRKLVQESGGNPEELASMAVSLKGIDEQLQSLDQLRSDVNNIREAFDNRLQDHADDVAALRSEVKQWASECAKRF